MTDMSRAQAKELDPAVRARIVRKTMIHVQRAGWRWIGCDSCRAVRLFYDWECGYCGWPVPHRRRPMIRLRGWWHAWTT